MALIVQDTSCHNSSMEKHIKYLRKAAEKTKRAIIAKLLKSKERFSEDIKTCEEVEKKESLLKKLNKISRVLEILENLLEDDVVKFALTSSNNLMSIATNLRRPLLLRLKAQVASHKPLSVRLAKVKSKLQESKESEGEEESGNDCSKSLDKMTLDNQIRKMRNNVKQAKVHIMSKLTRNIKKLSRLNGEKTEKLEKKRNKMVKKVECLKKLPEDDISRFALTSTLDLAKLSNDANSPLKTQVMATVATYKCVAPIVASFKSKFPEWDKNVPKVLKEKKKKRKLNTETKENDKENTKSLDQKPKSDVTSSDSEQCEISKINKQQEHNIQITKDIINKDSEKPDKSKINKQNEQKAHLISSDIEQSVKSKAKNKKEYKIEHNEMESSNKKIELNKRITKTVVDPFFMTSTNEEYVTNQVPSIDADKNSCWISKDNNFESNKFDKSTNWNTKRDFRTQSKFQKFDAQPYKRPKFDKSHFDNDLKYNKFTTSKSYIGVNRKEKRKALHQSFQEEPPEKLHPSWEAKKKLSTIASFQGKKIVFD